MSSRGWALDRPRTELKLSEHVFTRQCQVQVAMRIFAFINRLGKLPTPSKVDSDDVKRAKKPAKLGNNATSENDSDDCEDDQFCSKETAKNSVKYFLANSTLHGLKYLAEDEITIPERVFFGISFVVVVMLSGMFISNVYVKWSASPIIVSTSAKLQLTTGIPFPAITICSLNLALKSKAKAIKRDSTDAFLLMSLCDEASEMTMTYRGAWRYFKAVLMAVAQPCDQMLLYCSFGAHTEDCSLIFNSVLTDDGLCCTFNALDPQFIVRNYSDDIRLSASEDNHNIVAMNWTPEKGYDGELPEHFYPRISGGTGSRMGLTVILNSSSNEYYCTKTKSIGFKVLVHNPAELPKISNYGFLVTAGREARVPIEPIYQDASHSIRSLNKNVRRCLFSDEGDLSYYRIYSRNNCELECEAKILMERCDCVLYYLPRIDPLARICGPNDNNCTNSVQTQMESGTRNVSCAYCLPGCFELTYKVTLTSTTIVYGSFQSADNYPRFIFNDTTGIGNLSIIHFYYLSNTFRSTTKSEMFGFTEFLSNTGGLLGLFMGFSIFSLIEIFYYLTIRPYCASRTLKKHRLQQQLSHHQPSSDPPQPKPGKWFAPMRRISYKLELKRGYPFAPRTQRTHTLRRSNKNCMRQILWQQEHSHHKDAVIQPYMN